MCPHCKEARLLVITANEPWNDEHYQCPSCDSTYVTFQFEGIKADECDWMIEGEDGEPLAYKKKGEDRVIIIHPERALTKCVDSIKSLHDGLKNAQHLLADLSRLSI